MSLIYRRGAVYYYQQRIPQDLIESFGKTKHLYSLKTKDRNEATKLAALERTKWEHEYSLRRNDVKAIESITPNDITAIAVNEANAMLAAWQEENNRLKAAATSNPVAIESGALDPLTEFHEALSIIEGDYTEAFGLNEYSPLVKSEVDRLIEVNRLPPSLPPHIWIAIAQEYSRYCRNHIRSFLRAEVKGGVVRPLDTVERTSQLVTLSTAIETFIADKGDVGLKRLDKFKSAFEVLVAMLGQDKPLATITRAELRAFKDTLVVFPSNVRKHKLTRDLELSEVIHQAQAGKLNGLAALSASTVNTRLQIVSSLFNFAVAKRWISHNPCEGLSVKEETKAKDKRHPYSSEMLRSLLHQTQDNERFKWPVRIALTMGLRMNEILQLTNKDLVLEDGLHCLSVAEEGGKKVKTASSIRNVPIPEVLISAGFIEWANSRNGDLFPVPVPKSGYRSDTYSKRYNYFTSTHDLKAPKVGFHSLRHNFRDGLRWAEIPKELAESLGGWSNRAVSDNYGGGHLKQQQKDALDKACNALIKECSIPLQ